ncbi:ethanolamine utilization protein EutN [Rhodococcus sp. SC4]|nr:ethanolamine utilization protein EutN [Rhodococcus sp. SC4]TQC42270.1 ethanolamine utilization protein EutN [Rhodococcus sp. WS4]
MITATVTGSVWSTRRIEGIPAGALLEVEVDESGARLVAFDVLGTGLGERVIVAQGSMASNWFTGPPPPVDALIIGSIDADRASSQTLTTTTTTS